MIMSDEQEVIEPSFEVTDLIQHALDQDYNKANKVFGNMMGVKVNDALDQEKIAMADQIYNDIEPEEDDDYEEDDEDNTQGELDLEGEGESESDESYGEEEYEDEDEDEDVADEEEGDVYADDIEDEVHEQ
jgi:hypothetical protein